ncbi:hypothetical protein BH11MYX4_BH11MYX4_15680 [soil metagenome]
MSCVTPCELGVLPGRYRLRASGRGVRTFTDTIAVPDGGLAMQVRAPSKAGRVSGIVFTGFGAATLALGTAFVLGALLSAPGDSYNQTMAAVVGGMAAVVGGGSLVAGLLLLNGSRTGIEQTHPSPQAGFTF